jgi:hypothetical protein
MSVVWNSIKSSDADKLEPIQKRFEALCFNHLFPKAQFHYSPAVEQLKLHILHMRRHHLAILFLIHIYLGLKFCPSVLEIVGLWVLGRYFHDFAQFKFFPSCKNCLSARCASAANAVCRNVDVFRARNIFLKHIL